MDDHNAVYYRLFRGSDGRPVVVCMQWFDELDYDQSRFLTDEKFASEGEAYAWLGSICPICGCRRVMA